MLKFDSSKTNLWFSADIHYWHKNMCLAETVWDNPKENCRDFPSVKEMSRHLVDQLNKYIGQDDCFFFVGDWSFGGQNNIWNLRKQIICKNIFCISGNHDEGIRNNKILPNCKFVNGILTDGEPSNIGDEVVYAHNLFKSVTESLRIVVNNSDIILSHYPYESWRERLHLHGHTHSKLPTKPYRLDVGIDNAFKLYGEYRPFNWSDIKQQLKI